jgi:pyridinium-3,5-biscarboxylic acid mononucleotide sulfurtransferase
MLDFGLEKKLMQVRQILSESHRVLVAYSGGIDSTLLAKVAFDVLAENALAVTANSPSLLPADLEDAMMQASVIGISHLVTETAEMDNPNYTSNPVNRCYFCKSELHDTLKPLAQSWGYDFVVDGLNADDLQDYRPGIQAAKERGVRSPLAEVGISKLEVRMLSQYLNLPWWDKPSQPCLSSRFPYGESITVEKLQRVGKAELYLRHQIKELGWQLDMRVRSMGDVARIEIPAEAIANFVTQIPLVQLTEAFRAYGFTTVTLDLEGFRSGKLNDVLLNNLT